MKVRIKRIDKNLSLPVYETAGSVGFDLICRTVTKIKPASLALIPSNVIVKTPKGYMLMIASRSSTPGKKGLLTPHGIGIIDVDYSGKDDEILTQVYNFTNQSVTVERGEKIAQGVFVKIEKAEFIEVDEVNNNSRGGFGSTDGKRKEKK